MKAGIKLGVPVPNLKELRIAAKLSQMELSRRTGVSNVTILRAEKGGSIRKKNAVKLLHALGMNGNTPPAMETISTILATQPASPVEDDLVAAFRLLIEQLDKRIEARLAQALASKPDAPAVAPVSYVPPAPAPEKALTKDAAVSHGFPVTAMINNWAIRYERAFLKEYEVSGLTGPVRATLQKFAQLGEVYGGLGFKKLDRGMVRERRANWSRASYEFRVNRRWRVLVRKDLGDKAYTITRLVHHDDIE